MEDDGKQVTLRRGEALLVAGSSPIASPLVLVTVSIGIAFLSWKFVEMPFRSKAKETLKATVFGVASTATFSMSASYGKGATKPTVAFTLSVSGVPAGRCSNLGF